MLNLQGRCHYHSAEKETDLEPEDSFRGLADEQGFGFQAQRPGSSNAAPLSASANECLPNGFSPGPRFRQRVLYQSWCPFSQEAGGGSSLPSMADLSQWASDLISHLLATTSRPLLVPGEFSTAPDPQPHSHTLVCLRNRKKTRHTEGEWARVRNLQTMFMAWAETRSR